MRLALFFALVVAAFLAFRWFTSGGETEAPETAVSAIAAGAPVIDVRTDDEFASGHVAGARHVNVFDPDFEAKVDDLDRDQTVYVYCASGTRSGRAASVLEGMGFERVVNAGGLSDLQRAGAEVVR
ncbi:MAG: rhodanese-like domain-containing protein [Bacteroidota bacterium]